MSDLMRFESSSLELLRIFLLCNLNMQSREEGFDFPLRILAVEAKTEREKGEVKQPQDGIRNGRRQSN